MFWQIYHNSQSFKNSSIHKIQLNHKNNKKHIFFEVSKNSTTKNETISKWNFCGVEFFDLNYENKTINIDEIFEHFKKKKFIKMFMFSSTKSKKQLLFWKTTSYVIIYYFIFKKLFLCDTSRNFSMTFEVF